ncbi:hypothetical protein NXS19_002523 [Fusarium pseudograminearum]|uniref:Uncharacterized protein n=1 Tax=Fusarium pseudograminearum (strain CS3096) TaxID=1028729 RepID=K3VIE4_FUSPC|nr:hypothetical protein FPSE_05723 [Fusarium pseudograminearum CS3096]EKJ74069.1 hypothetical protein FPSE_05723 [Fusarium pseudograminearum CS3096]UZP34707.1 hypothetical protein NXS19_002523 [Fusarium pseudograminearum]
MSILIWLRDFLVSILWAIAASIGRIFGCEKALTRRFYAAGSLFGLSPWTTVNTKHATTTERILEWRENIPPGPPPRPPKRSKRKSTSRRKKAMKQA